MRLRRFGTAATLSLTVVLAGCGGTSQTVTTVTVTASSSSSSSTPTPSPTAAPTPVATVPPTPTPLGVSGPGATDPVLAVQQLTKRQGPCAGQGTFSARHSCPLTDRLAQRLDESPFSGSTGPGEDPLCRCGDNGNLTYTLISQVATTALVHQDLGSNGRGLRWTVIQGGPPNGNTSLWYVDDQDLGCPQTSIYNPAYDFKNETSTAAANPTC